MSRVLILATDGFEQSELTGPRDALNQAGIETIVASPRAGTTSRRRPCQSER